MGKKKILKCFSFFIFVFNHYLCTVIKELKELKTTASP